MQPARKLPSRLNNPKLINTIASTNSKSELLENQINKIDEINRLNLLGRKKLGVTL